MPSCSRYLAMVRRLTGMFLSRSRSRICSSESGCCRAAGMRQRERQGKSTGSCLSSNDSIRRRGHSMPDIRQRSRLNQTPTAYRRCFYQRQRHLVNRLQSRADNNLLPEDDGTQSQSYRGEPRLMPPYILHPSCGMQSGGLQALPGFCAF